MTLHVVRRSGASFPTYDQAATPSSPSAGEFWWDRNIHVLKRYDGTAWRWVGLDDLSNVDTAGKADSNILEWDTDPDPDVWTSAAKPSGGSGSSPTGSAAMDEITASETTSSTSYTDLATAGPEVTLDVPSSGKVLIAIGCQGAADTGAVCWMGFALSDTNTVAASTDRRVLFNQSVEAQGNTFALTGLTAGTTTFTAKYATNAGTATFSRRTLVVVPL